MKTIALMFATLGAVAAPAVPSVPVVSTVPGHAESGVPTRPVRTGAIAPVRVVATLPVYAAIARAIGGAEVEVVSIADPNEDSHFVRPKPSYALELRRADLFITTGLDLELWVPALLDKSGNSDVMDGRPGYVSAHTGITLLDIPASADRSQGDVHVFGNPHLHTDPLRALQVARNITIGLGRVAPDRKAVWDAGLAAYQAETYERLFGARLVEMLGGETLERLALDGRLFPFLDENEFEGAPLTGSLGGWLAQSAPMRGIDIICYHVNWSYFEDRFGVNCAEYVEAKPGIPPTPRHVARLIDLMRTQGLSVVLAASYFDPGRVGNVANRGDARSVIVPMQTGARPGLDTYFDLVDLWVTEITTALQ